MQVKQALCSRRRSLLAVAVVAPLLLASGCQTPSGSSEPGANRSPFQAKTPVAVVSADAPLPDAPPRQWPDAALDVDNYRVTGWGLVSVPPLQAYLNRLYASVKAAGGHPEWPGSVYILADPALRGTSTPAGNIFVSLGWLRTVESEDEMVAFLSHEFGHVYLGHHASHQVSNAGDSAMRMANFAWNLATRKVLATARNGTYAIDAARVVMLSAAMPAWQRSQEGEADRFGAALGLRQGYSYTQGFKLFLEHIDSYDALQREQAMAASKRAADNGRKAAGDAAAERARGQRGPGQTVTGLEQAWADLQVKAAEASADTGASLNALFAQLQAKITDDHDAAASRETVLSDAIAPLLAGKPRPAARVQPWTAALAEPDTAAVLDRYALLAAVDEAMAGTKLAEARQLANEAASGPTADDALPLYYRQVVTGQAVPDLPARHERAAERSWKLELMIADSVARHDRALARGYVEQEFNRFHKAEPAWPDMIAFYRENGFGPQAKAMAQDCQQRMPSYRDACADAAKTEAERKTEAAKADAEAKRIVNKFIKPK